MVGHHQTVRGHEAAGATVQADRAQPDPVEPLLRRPETVGGLHPGRGEVVQQPEALVAERGGAAREREQEKGVESGHARRSSPSGPGRQLNSDLPIRA